MTEQSGERRSSNHSSKLSTGLWVPIAVIVVVLIAAASTLAYVAWQVQREHSYASSLLTNLAAGLICLAVTVLLAAIIAARRLKDVARPVLELIQRLCLDGKISPESARKSVRCAVAVLSEGNVRAIIPQGEKAQSGKPCPVCTLAIELAPGKRKNRCLYCNLPDALWNLPID